MVRPISDEERAAFMRQLKVGFVVLVAASAALITLGSGERSLVAVAIATLSGAAVGTVLVWLVVPDMDYRGGRR